MPAVTDTRTMIVKKITDADYEYIDILGLYLGLSLYKAIISCRNDDWEEDGEMSFPNASYPGLLEIGCQPMRRKLRTEQPITEPMEKGTPPEAQKEAAEPSEAQKQSQEAYKRIEAIYRRGTPFKPVFDLKGVPLSIKDSVFSFTPSIAEIWKNADKAIIEGAKENLKMWKEKVEAEQKRKEQIHKLPEHPPENSPHFCKYHRRISGKNAEGIRHDVYVDIYNVIQAWKVTNAGLQHVIKKVTMPGERGAKDFKKDLLEGIQAINRAIELYENEEKENHD